MKLLICTQKMDRNDPVLAFFEGWVRALAPKFETVTVLCLARGEFTVPANVSVTSLGKDDGRGRITYLRRFYKTILSRANEYDAVFVHMNPEYVLLGGIFWRLLGKRIVLWYNHEKGGLRLRSAAVFAHRVLHTSPQSASATLKKSIRMPAGIDTCDFFQDPSVGKIPRSVLYLGRLAPIKGVDVIVEAVKRLLERGVFVHLTVIGDALPQDRAYRDRLMSYRRVGSMVGHFVMNPAERSRKLVAQFYNAHAIFVNASPPGLFDKTVLEAMACGAIPVVSSKAFADVLTGEFRFQEGNAEDLARVLERNLARSAEEREKLGEKFSRYVKENHDLQLLAKRIRGLYGND